MFGQYDGFVIVDLPDARAAAATSLAVSSTGVFEHLETHELIEAEDLNPLLEQAKGITPAPRYLRAPRRTVGCGDRTPAPLPAGSRIEQGALGGSTGAQQRHTSTCRATRGELAGPPVGVGLDPDHLPERVGTTGRHRRGSCWPGQ
jgi:hypothetical protein